MPSLTHSARVRRARTHVRRRSESNRLAQLAGLLAAGRLEIPIAKVYLLADVRDAYRELEQRHTIWWQGGS
jgi:NADPH:quinone reductase-like Zn-dependent oxidoreductase